MAPELDTAVSPGVDSLATNTVPEPSVAAATGRPSPAPSRVGVGAPLRLTANSWPVGLSGTSSRWAAPSTAMPSMPGLDVRLGKLTSVRIAGDTTAIALRSCCATYTAAPSAATPSGPPLTVCVVTAAPVALMPTSRFAERALTHSRPVPSTATSSGDTAKLCTTRSALSGRAAAQLASVAWGAGDAVAGAALLRVGADGRLLVAAALAPPVPAQPHTVNTTNSADALIGPGRLRRRTGPSIGGEHEAEVNCARSRPCRCSP